MHFLQGSVRTAEKKEILKLTITAGKGRSVWCITVYVSIHPTLHSPLLPQCRSSTVVLGRLSG